MEDPFEKLARDDIEKLARSWDQKFRRRVDSMVALHRLPYWRRATFLLGPVSPLGLLWEVFQVMLNLLYMSFWMAKNAQGQEVSNVILFSGWVGLGFFIADFLLHLLRCYNYHLLIKFFTNLATITDLITIVAYPIGTDLFFLRVFRVFRTFDTYNGMQYHWPLNLINIAWLYALRLVFLFLCFWLAVSMGYYLVEPTDNLEDAFYFMIVTLTTVGYGDITPKTPAGRGFVLAVILLVLTAVPYQVGQLISFSQQASNTHYRIMQTSLRFPLREPVHSVVAGDISYDAGIFFFRDYFHSHHGTHRHTLALTPNGVLDPQLVDIISSSDFFLNHIRYLAGCAISHSSLKHAYLGTAVAALVLPPSDELLKDVEDHESESDKRVIASMLAMHYFQPVDRSYRILGPLFDPSRISTYFGRTSNLQALPSMTSFRAFLMSQSVLTPGFASVISDLLVSKGQLSIDRSQNHPWMIEHTRGSANSLFTAPAPSSIWNSSWGSTTLRLWQQFRIVLIGLIRRHPTSGLTSVRMNVPHNTAVIPTDRLVMIGFPLRDRVRLAQLGGQILRDTSPSMDPVGALGDLRNGLSHQDFARFTGPPGFKMDAELLGLDASSDKDESELGTMSELQDLTVPRIVTKVSGFKPTVVVIMVAFDESLAKGILAKLVHTLAMHRGPTQTVVFVSPKFSPEQVHSMTGRHMHHVYFLAGALDNLATFGRVRLAKAKCVIITTNWRTSSLGIEQALVMAAVNRYLSANRSGFVNFVSEVRHPETAIYQRPLASSTWNLCTEDLVGRELSTGDFLSLAVARSGSLIESFTTYFSMLSMVIHDPDLTYVINHLCHPESNFHSRLLALPQELIDRILAGEPLRYSQLFEWLLNNHHGTLIGLFRSRHNYDGCPLSYIFTNPCVTFTSNSRMNRCFSFFLRSIIDEGSCRNLPRVLDPEDDPVIHPADRLYLLPGVLSRSDSLVNLEIPIVIRPSDREEL